MVAVYDHETTVYAPQADPRELLNELTARLERGLDIIDKHKHAGLPVDHLEEHWISLLKDYELAFANEF
jgi:hypothetical protein